MEALRNLSTLWLLTAAIKCQASTIFEGTPVSDSLTAAMDLISNSNSHLILWHSSHLDCMEDVFCSMFFQWNLNCKSSGKIFTVSSNSTTAFATKVQPDSIILTDFTTANQTRSTFQKVDKPTLQANIWVIPIWIPILIPMFTRKAIENTSDLLERHSSIQLNTQVYVIATDKVRWRVFEIYRIPGIQKLITKEVTKLSLSVWGRRIDLMGAPLRFAFMDTPPLLYKEIRENKTILSGSYSQFIHILQHTLNLSIELIETEDGVLGTHSVAQNSSSGVVRLLVEKKADIVANFMYQTHDRSQVMSYVPIGRQKINLYTSKKISAGTTLHFADIFAEDYLILLIILIIVFGALFSLLTMYTTGERSTAHAISGTVLAIGSLLPLSVGEAINKTLARKTYFRILFFSLLMFGVVNFGTFGGHLTSQTVVKDQEQINSLQDLLETDQYDFYLEQGAYMQQLFEESAPTSDLRKVWEKYIEGHPEKLVSIRNLANQVKSGLIENVAFSYSDIPSLFADIACELHVSKSILSGQSYGTGLQKSSEYLEVIKYAVTNGVIGSGHLNKILTYNEDAIKAQETCQSLHHPHIEYSTVCSIFTGLMIFIGVSIVVAILEYLWVLKMGKALKNRIDNTENQIPTTDSLGTEHHISKMRDLFANIEASFDKVMEIYPAILALENESKQAIDTSHLNKSFKKFLEKYNAAVEKVTQPKLAGIMAVASQQSGGQDQGRKAWDSKANDLLKPKDLE